MLLFGSKKIITETIPLNHLIYFSILQPLDFSSLRNGLSRESRVWRVFLNEDEALKCAEKHSHFGVIAFMYLHRNTNKKYYLVTHPLELYHRNLNHPIRHIYEIIQPEKPSKLHVQLCYEKICNPKHNGAKMTNTFIKILLYVLRTKFYLELNTHDVLNLDFSTYEHFNRLLIIQYPFLLQFKSTKEASDCVIETCNLIRSALYENGDLCKKVDVSEEELKSLQIQNNDFECYSLFVNETIYSELHYSLILGSYDFRCKSSLKISLENTFAINSVKTKRIKDELLFLASILRQHIPVPMGKEPEINTEEPEIDYCIPEPKAKPNNTSPYPVLDVFMVGVMAPCTIDVVLSYQNGTVLVYCTREAGFCHNIGRFHSKNRTMHVVLLDRAVHYQKCHDPDCKGFASKWRPLPWAIQKTIGITDEWHQSIVQAFQNLCFSENNENRKRIKLN
jgi:hypothetical protein